MVNTAAEPERRRSSDARMRTPDRLPPPDYPPVVNQCIIGKRPRGWNSEKFSFSLSRSTHSCEYFWFSFAPKSRCHSFVRVLLVLATQMFAPSKIIETGLGVTLKVPTMEPSLARSLVTVLEPELATQMSAPSKTTAFGRAPTL